MLKKGLWVLVAAISLSSCLKDPVDSETTALGKEQEKIMADYLLANNINAKKEQFYDVYGNYYPIYSSIDSKGDTITKYTKNEALWVSYTLKTLENRVVETKTQADSVLIYPGGFGGKIPGLSVCGSMLLGNGGKGLFLIPSTLGFGKNPPGGVEYNAILYLDMQVHNRLNEDQQIQYFIKKNKVKVDEVTTSGLVFSKTLALDTAATSAKDAKNVTVKYTGKFITGIEFDKNTTGASFSLEGVVPGFAEAIRKMKVGDKATAILPYKIAYGEYGNSNIPGFMPLVFDIELVKVDN